MDVLFRVRRFELPVDSALVNRKAHFKVIASFLPTCPTLPLFAYANTALTA